DPTYASEHDIEKFVAYGLLVCHYDLQEGIFSRHDLVDDDHIRELREAFLCCVEDTILYFWTGDVEIGQTDFDLGDALSTNVGNSEEGDNEEFMFQWIPHRVTEECFVFDLHCSVLVGEGTGGEPTTLFLDMEAIQDREKVREVFRKVGTCYNVVTTFVPLEDWMTVTTTNGKPFTMTQHAEMARLVFLRFGEDAEAATAAWSRMLESNCEVADFMELVCYPEHTENCAGWCQDPAQEHDHQALAALNQEFLDSVERFNADGRKRWLTISTAPDDDPAVAAITATVSLTGELELDTRLVFTENVCFDDYDGTEQRCITDLEYIEEGARIRVSVTNIDGDQIDDFDLEKLSLPVEELVELHELEDRLGVLSDKLMPMQGPAETFEGELVRAINKILYRFYNDGDYWHCGYGCETAGPAAAFLVAECPVEVEWTFNPETF
ncbi:unnamed protein product, partial [Symbiodinium microadriaticum]